VESVVEGSRKWMVRIGGMGRQEFGGRRECGVTRAGRGDVPPVVDLGECGERSAEEGRDRWVLGAEMGAGRWEVDD
jgi:hypothetical protein